MKLLQANPKPKNKQTILAALNAKERMLRSRPTSFSKTAKNKWKHVKVPGRVTVSNATGDILFAKIESKTAADEGRLFEVFIGYLTRHCGDLIDTITIYYR